MDSIHTSDAPEPGGHYSQAVVHDGLIFVSGQLPIHPHTGKKETGPVELQAELVLANLRAILEAAGSGLDRVLKTTVYIQDMRHWDTVNRIYADRFGAHRPARAVVPAPGLHHGFLIEMEAVACRP
ncbi:RidA family protein [bacterium]|nr:RidA family protein [bacterium]